MSDIVLQVQGDKELIDKLNRFGVAILKLKPEMEDIGQYLTNFFSGEVFTSRGRVIGEPWPALNPAYAAFKARKFPGRPPLVQRGLMQRSFKHDATELSTRLYNEAEYFDYHQEGRGVPQRVMMLVDQRRETAIIKIVEGGVRRQMGAIGV